MKANYHTHTYLCGHAKGTPADYIEEAIKAEVDILGFSDHGPYPDFNTGVSMSYQQLETYIQWLDEAKDKYRNKIRILKGLEIEYFKRYTVEDNKYYEYLLTKAGLDYLIMGEHQFITSYGSNANIFVADAPELAVEYAKQCVEGMATGYFSILAHPDLFCINPYPWDDNYERASDIIIEGAVKYKTILEYNANGLRRGIKEYTDGLRYPYPHKRFWDKVRGTEIRVIAGSDAHAPELVWDDSMQQAVEQLKDFKNVVLEI